MMANHIISVSNRRFEDVPMPEYVLSYHANIQTVEEFFSALEQRLKAVNIPLIAREYLLTDRLLEEMARFKADQSRRQAALQSIRDGFAAKLDCVSAWKKVSAVVFVITAAVSAAGAAVNATADSERPVAAAAAAAASILLVALGKWIDSLLKKSESVVKKHMEVIRAMIVAGKLTIKDLEDIYALAREMKAEAESIDDGAMEVDVRNKMAALNNSFEKILKRANDNASSGREAVQQSILKNMG